MDQYEFKNNIDFRLYNHVESNSEGCTHKNEYYLHPRAFKICLMRSLKTREYADYYLLLEECIKYFNDYQILLKEKYIIKLKTKNKEHKYIIKEKDYKICSLEEKMNSIIKQNDGLLKSLNKAHYKLDETLEKLDDVHEELENTHNELEETTFIKFSILNFMKVIKQKIKFFIKFYFLRNY